MKILRYLMMAILIVGMSGVAHAAGFSWNLQDPPTSDSPFFQVVPGVPFSFGFASCSEQEGNPPITYTGCATGQNVSSVYLTSFEFSFASGGVLAGLTPTCISDGFTALACGLSSDGTEFVLDFTADCTPGLPCGIAPNSFFQIFENATDGPDFPDVAGVANTPEPSSIWLALSGMGSLGYLVRRRRRISNR